MFYQNQKNIIGNVLNKRGQKPDTRGPLSKTIAKIIQTKEYNSQKW